MAVQVGGLGSAEAARGEIMNDVIPMADANGVGPLEVIERDIGGLEYFIVPAGGMISDDLASGIIDRDDYTPEQMRAWARLFAAAPDLLEALKLLYREMELS